MMTITNAKDLFLLEEGVAYLNCANMSPMLKSVKEAGLQALQIRAAPWKLTTKEWFNDAEILRGLAAKSFQTKDDNIAIIPSASYGLAAAAKNLAPDAGKEIIILENQFPSNYYVWEQLAAVKKLKINTIQKTIGKTLTECILEKINTNTGIIAIPNCHWIDGTWIDLQQISDAAKAVGSFLILDLSQSLGVLPIDIEKIQPDFAVAVGYKWMLGPYSLGYLYVSKKWQEQGEPLEYPWATRMGSDNFAALTNYTSDYRPGARKFDMGEFSQINLMPMAVAGLQQILDWDIISIQSNIKTLTDIIVEYKNTHLFQNESSENVGHIVNIPLNNMDIDALKNRLNQNKISVSFRGNSIRIAPHLYNDAAEVGRLLSCLAN